MRPVRNWLWFTTALVFLMVLVGGATRLTESGLSITEWNLVTGVLPPLSEAAWLVEFEKYKQIPQYQELFPTMTLAEFKVIYYWEWGHRFLGRVIGLVFFVPFVWFVATGRVNASLFWKLLALLALGGFQGFVGWWMVQSGLVGRVEVAAERLTVHLLLASFTLIGLILVAMSLRVKPAQAAAPGLRGQATALIVLIVVQIGLGALVAGSRAALTYNTWPLMDGHFIPPTSHLFVLEPLWRNVVDNMTLVQFQHRMFAYLVVLALIVHAVLATRASGPSGAARRAWALVAIALIQSALGVLTLLYVLPSGTIPIGLALAHQGVAFILLAMAVAHRAVMTAAPPAHPQVT